MNQELEFDLVQVETLLRRAAGSFAYPATPQLAAQVRARLSERPAFLDRVAGALAASWRRPAAMAAAALIAAAFVALGAALAVPQSRSALADFFGLSNVRIDREPAVGPTPPALSPNSFARPSDVADAQATVDFPLRFPTRDRASLEPDAVYVQGDRSDQAVVIFAYEEEGFDLYQTRQGIFGKGAPDPSLIHEISFAGRRAYWVDQGGHIAQFLDAQGRVVVESRRTVDRATLLWEENGITYRLETSLSQADAVAVAESLR